MTQTHQPKYDIFRDSWIRYFGYANEIGEALRPVLTKKTVRATYGMAFTYVCADTLHKGIKTWQKNGEQHRILIAIGDAFVWQTFASVIIPGYVVNRISYYSGLGLDKYTTKMPTKLRRPIQIGLTLAAIPFIITPIDKSVTFVMDYTVRWLYKHC